MADKFTRVGTVEGDIWYATTASSTKSIESLEDNIDDKMLGFIGIDATGGSILSSTTETKIGEVIVTANSARTRLIIIAEIRFENVANSVGASSTFKIRTGTSATATSNTQRQSITLLQNSDASGTGAGRVGTVMIVAITTSDEVFTGQIYVHVTGTNSVNNSSVTSFCDSILVLGI